MVNLTHQQIKSDLINDFSMDENEAEFLATKSLSDINKTLQATYQQELTSLAQPSQSTGWLIKQIPGISFESEHIHLYELMDDGLKSYLDENGITIDALNSSPLTENTIHHNENNININGSEALVKIVSLSIQRVLKDSPHHDDLHIRNMVYDIDAQYQSNNPHLSKQNYDLTDLHKNQLGIKVLTAGETINNDPLSMCLNDPDFYDFYTDHPSANSPKWNDILHEIKFQFDFSDTQLAILDNKLSIFTTLYDSQEQNPDWKAMPINQRINFSLDVYNSSESTEDSIEEAINSHIKSLRNKTLGLTLKNNSGNEYSTGYTTTLVDENSEYVASLELYGSMESTDEESFTKFKTSSDYADQGLEKVLLLQALYIANLDQVSFNPYQQLMDSIVAKPMLRVLSNANLINYHNDSYFVTPAGEKFLNDRDFNCITQSLSTQPKTSSIKKKSTNTMGL